MEGERESDTEGGREGETTGGIEGGYYKGREGVIGGREERERDVEREPERVHDCISLWRTITLQCHDHFIRVVFGPLPFHMQTGPGRGWLIFLIHQNTIEPIAKRLLIPINGLITHSCRTFGGDKKSRKRVIPVCCFLLPPSEKRSIHSESHTMCLVCEPNAYNIQC